MVFTSIYVIFIKSICITDAVVTILVKLYCQYECTNAVGIGIGDCWVGSWECYENCFSTFDSRNYHIFVEQDKPKKKYIYRAAWRTRHKCNFYSTFLGYVATKARKDAKNCNGIANAVDTCTTQTIARDLRVLSYQNFLCVSHQDDAVIKCQWSFSFFYFFFWGLGWFESFWVWFSLAIFVFT